MLARNDVTIRLVRCLTSTFRDRFRHVRRKKVQAPRLNVPKRKRLRQLYVSAFTNNCRLVTIVRVRFRGIKEAYAVRFDLRYRRVAIGVKDSARILSVFSNGQLRPCHLPSATCKDMPSAFQVTSLLSAKLESFVH